MFETEQINVVNFTLTLRDYLRPPFRKFEIRTPMSIAHATRILHENVEPPRRWGLRTSSKRGYFEGRIAGGRFKIHRVIRHQESFRPIIEGRILNSAEGTTVALTMRMAWMVTAIWFAIIAFLFWSTMSVDSTIAATFDARVALIAMTAFMYLIASVCFAIEVRIAMQRLLDLLRPGLALVTP